MRFVIVTGMSGGGKSSAIRMLEDLGFYCVDNLPVSLIDKFAEVIALPNAEIQKAALGLDVRTDHSFTGVSDAIDGIRRSGYPLEVLFMDAADEVLIKRYKESRRAHPLSGDGRIEEGIEAERRVLQQIREQADYVIDTSQLITRELRGMLEQIFVEEKDYRSLMITILSFGFKYGIPVDADLVFDVRFLPNPFYVEELKHLTGVDAPVRDYVMQAPEAAQFVEKIKDLLTFLIPGYIKEGKNQLVIAVGCTGGQHRSVAVADAVYEAIREGAGYGIKCVHRDYRKNI
ncbi:MAG: RNase adapter RapZ [Lachnospiraceae bacterium]|nr:RNase adapter RapZ [Lachnospiraceae bacterium]